jgi:outer membrane protein assembly factor BamD
MYIKTIFYLVLLLFISVIAGCGSSGSDITTDDPDKAYQTAKRNFDKKDYLQAIDDFTLIKTKFAGSSISDKSQYYLGMCYLKREEFLLAAYEFEYLIKNYTTSSYATDSRFQLGMCYYGLSPKYALDQTYTYMAINEFKNFLELYPTDKNAPIAEAKIKELRNKLAQKLFESAELYNKMENYKAATYYYESIISDYYDTDYADDALYGKIKTLITRKRIDEAKTEIERFESKYSGSILLNKVLSIKKTL